MVRALSVVDDQVRLRIPLSFPGQQLTLTAAGTLTVANGKVRFQVSQLTPEGDNLPNLNGLVNQYKQRLSVTINVPALPYKLTVNKVQAHFDAGIADEKMKTLSDDELEAVAGGGHAGARTSVFTFGVACPQ